MPAQSAGDSASAALAVSPRRRALAEFWHYYSMNTGAVIGLAVFSALVLMAIFAPLIAPHAPDEQFRDFLLTPPAWQAGGQSTFLLGTDAVGRDMLSRLIHGARYSLFIGLVVVVFALVSGIVLGVLAGYFRGWVDTLIMRVMDIILAFPSLLLALVLVATLGPGLLNAMLAIALVLQPHFARLTRAAVMARSVSAGSPSAAGPRGRSFAGLMVTNGPAPPPIRSPALRSGVGF